MDNYAALLTITLFQVQFGSTWLSNLPSSFFFLLSLTAGEHGPVDTLFHCIEQISVWMQNNFLQLNSDKTEIIVCRLQK